MKIIEKDILTVEEGFLFQQVNCQKKFGSGLALQVREKWPFVYEEYIKYSDMYKYDFQRLGKMNLVPIRENLTIVNIFGQLYYGYDGKRYTDYSALNTAFESFYNLPTTYKTGKQIYFPMNFGAFRGGGDWTLISKMIEFYFPNAVICKLPQIEVNSKNLVTKIF